MTKQQRNMLRDLINQARRQQLRIENEGGHTWTGCVTCGGPYDEITVGCKRCNERLRKRQLRGPGPFPDNACRSCGINYHDTTPGCHTCRSRHAYRDRVRRRAQ